MYRKGQYAQGNKEWAVSGDGGVDQYYQQLSPELQQMFHDFDYNQAAAFYKQYFGQPTVNNPPTQPPGPTLPNPSGNPYNSKVDDLTKQIEERINNPQTNPYDQSVQDALNQFLGRVNNPTTNPYDSQVADLLARLTNLINNPKEHDVYNSPEYLAQKAMADREAQKGIRTAQESLGSSGFARSTNLTDRAQRIASDETNYLMTQVAPAILSQFRQQDQQELSNLGSLLQATQGQQGMFDQRDQQGIANLATYLEQVSGQQGLFDTRTQQGLQNLSGLIDLYRNQQTDYNTNEQNRFQNQLGLENLGISKSELELKQKSSALEQEKFSWQKQLDEVSMNTQQLSNALARTQQFGSVNSEQDAAILGVPVGTPTWQAQDAANERQSRLDIMREEASNAMARLNKQLAADKENLQTKISADKEAAKTANNYNTLLNIWDRTGKAPSGLEQFGINEGTPISKDESPQTALARIQLEQVMKELNDQQKIELLSPTLRTEYGVSQATAEAMAAVLDSPTYEAAIAEYNANLQDMTTHGVDVKAVKKAIDDKLKPKEGEKDTGKSWWDKISGKAGDAASRVKQIIAAIPTLSGGVPDYLKRQIEGK